MSSRARQTIADGQNTLFFSAASGWEIAIKARLGRLRVAGEPASFIPGQLLLNTIEVLPVQLHHALQVYAPPDHHRDPVDRLLIAQSQLEDLPLLTANPLIAPHPVSIIW